MAPTPTDTTIPPLDQIFGRAPAGEDPELSDLAATALAAAVGAAALTGKAFGQARRTVDTKSSPTDLVSEVDRGAEALVTKVIGDCRPGDGILGEEGATRDGTTGVRWIIDPLDGTTNFLWGLPVWSVSIAAERDGRPVVGVVADPVNNAFYAAVEGRGAYRNGVRLRVADGRSSLATALVATGFSYEGQRRAWQGAVVASLLPRVRDIRRLGSAALDLCLLASGAYDAFYEWGLNPWDVAAGTVICREAGGVVEVIRNNLTVATTPSLRAPIQGLLTELSDAAGVDPGAPSAPS